VDPKKKGEMICHSQKDEGGKTAACQIGVCSSSTIQPAGRKKEPTSPGITVLVRCAQREGSSWKSNGAPEEKAFEKKGHAGKRGLLYLQGPKCAKEKRRDRRVGCKSRLTTRIPPPQESLSAETTGHSGQKNPVPSERTSVWRNEKMNAP